MPIIRSISGLRGTLGDSLTPQVIIDYTSAFCKMLPEGEIVFGRDGRPSGIWIEKLVEGTLAACGRKFKKLGIVPTPTVQLMTEHSEAAGGIAITASHNPEIWNGLKFMNSEGIFLDKEENEKLWENLDNRNFEFSDNPLYRYRDDYINALDIHIDKILDLELFRETDFLKKIRKNKYKIVVDAVNASGSDAVLELLERFGCDVTSLYCNSSGIFPHTPEPIPQNLTELARVVKEKKADIGIAVDPDADRLVLIDGNGVPIGEEKTVVIAIESVLANRSYFDSGETPAVVVNHSTTRLVEDICKDYGAVVLRSAVGEINVVKLMKKAEAVVGGEGSGGVILPACHYGRDSLVGISLLLVLLAVKEKSLTEIAASYPKYEVVKIKKEFTGSLDNILNAAEEKFQDAKIIREDGIKIIYPKSWVQLRASNTEPIVRVIAEAPAREEAEELSQRMLGCLPQ